MKTKSVIAIMLFAVVAGKAFAQKSSTLPEVPAPRELTEVGSEFAEGTITRLSDQDVSVFVPWAQNAQSVLTKALKDIETMTVQQQVRHLTAIIKSVVKNSGQKNYQMFMRFALNRTLLLVQELTLQSDWNVPGTSENVLDLQIKGINLALQFYESDLAYQRRVNRGNDSVNLSYAMFGSAFGKTMLQSIQNITDASAQYRLLYKTLEMINWDFSRDSIAIEFSDTIVEIYNTLNILPEQPSNNDFESVLAVRRLNVLLAPITAVERTILMSSEESRRQLEEQDRLARLNSAQREMEAQLATGVAVIVEDTFFIITGTNNRELYSNCISKFPGTQADEILFTYGDRTLNYQYNSSSNWTKDAACQLIISKLPSLSRVTKQPNLVYGAIEQHEYSFQGPTLSSLLYQCHTFYQSKGNISVDEIYVGINNQAPVLHYNRHSSWSRSMYVCQQLLHKALSL